MRRGLFNLWTPASSRTTTTATSDSPFMEGYSSEDYDDDDYVVVPSNDPIIIEEIAHEVPNAVGSEEGEAPVVDIASSLPLSLPAVTPPSWETTTTVVVPTFLPAFHHQYCPESASVEMFLSSAALFVLQECRNTIKSWVERFFSRLERLGIRFYRALRTLIRKPFVWAARKHAW